MLTVMNKDHAYASAAQTQPAAQHLPLHAFHLSQRARLVASAAYEMPITAC